MNGQFFTPETKDLIVKVGDEAVKLPFWAEPFDGLAIRWVVNFVDVKADKFIPDSIDTFINEAIQAGFNGDWDKASEIIGTTVNTLVNIPLLDEDAEQSLIVNLLKVLTDLIRVWIKGNKEVVV